MAADPKIPKPEELDPNARVLQHKVWKGNRQRRVACYDWHTKTVTLDVGKGPRPTIFPTTKPRADRFTRYGWEDVTDLYVSLFVEVPDDVVQDGDDPRKEIAEGSETVAAVKTKGKNKASDPLAGIADLVKK